MSTHLVLDNTLGVGLIATMVAAMLTGVTISQALYYYTHQNDRWHLKYLVGVVVASDLIHQALITHSIYWYVVTSWGNPAALQLIVWSTVVECLFVGLNAFLVQSFLTLRVWHLSGFNKPITGTIAVVVVGQFVANNVSTGFGFNKTYAELAPLQWLSMFCNTLTVVGDVLISAALCILLHHSRTGFRRSDTMINTLIVFSVNTGLITSTFAVASLLSLIFAKRTFLNMAFFWCISRLYTNCLLATLNARKMIGAIGYPHDISFSLNFNTTNISPGTQHPAHLSITTDTTKDSARDEQVGCGTGDVKNIDSELGNLSAKGC